jgi:hypothetical protein
MGVPSPGFRYLFGHRGNDQPIVPPLPQRSVYDWINRCEFVRMTEQANDSVSRGQQKSETVSKIDESI